MKRIGPLSIGLVIALGLAACSGNDAAIGPGGTAQPSSAAMTGSPSGAATATANEADIRFAQAMIPHHQQAIQMADLALTRARKPQVRELARDIKAAQGPEIQTMSSWLRSWGQQVPTTGGHVSGDGHGMMSEQQMNELMRSSDDQFDRMFLEMMIEHHEGAVHTARTEQTAGRYPDAKAMASEIIRTQTAETATMKSMLDSL